MSNPSFIKLTLHQQLQPHWVKALFQGSCPRWIQTKSDLAQTITLEAVFLDQMDFLEAAQDLEGTLAKDRPHIRTPGPHSPPETIQEIATVLEILDTSSKVGAALEATMETLLESLDKVRASVRGCLTWAPEAT